MATCSCCRASEPANHHRARPARPRAVQCVGRQDYLIPIPGQAVDYDFVAAEIGELSRTMNLVEIAYDPAGACTF